MFPPQERGCGLRFGAAELRSGEQREGNEWRQALLSVLSPWHRQATCQAQFAACQAANHDRTGGGSNMKTRAGGAGGTYSVRDRWTSVFRSVSGQEEAITGISNDTRLLLRAQQLVLGAADRWAEAIHCLPKWFWESETQSVKDFRLLLHKYGCEVWWNLQ